MNELDFTLGGLGKEEGMARAAVGAGKAWAAAAEAAVFALAKTHTTFTSDDLWAAGLEKPDNARALGPVLSRLAKQGCIRQTGQFRKTAQASRHHAPIAIWEFTTPAQQPLF